MLQQAQMEKCEKCPGSMWGERSICRIHKRSIGQVESCIEWANVTENDQKMFLLSIEPAIEIVQKVEEELKDYHWMLKEINRLRNYLEEAGEDLSTRYGVENSLPKSKGKVTDKTNWEVQRRERQWNRLILLEQKVKKIDDAVEKITDDRERTVIECILDGERMNIIAKHVGVSRQLLHEIKRKLVKKIAMEIYHDDICKGLLQKD